MNNILIPVLTQALVIFSALCFVGALVLNPLSPASKRVGYTFLVPLLLIGFMRYITTSVSMENLILIASFAMPVLILLLTLLKHSFDNNVQMITATFVLVLMLLLGVHKFGELFVKTLNSPVVLLVLIAFHVALLLLLRRQKRTLDWIIFTILLLGNLIIAYKNIGALLPAGYVINLFAYGLALRVIYIEHQYMLVKTQEEHKEIRSDFHQAVEREVRKRTKRMEWVQDQIKEKSKLDTLTGALMKKPLLDLIDTYIYSNEIRKFSILMFDIDKFKNLNDSYGHIVGDKCLKQLVSIAFSTLRENDSIGRYGGDEFFIILPDQTASQAMHIANRFRENIQENTEPSYTISIGISSYPWDGETHKDLIKVADDGLYKSKELGRNRVSYTGYLKIGHDFDSADSPK